MPEEHPRPNGAIREFVGVFCREHLASEPTRVWIVDRHSRFECVGADCNEVSRCRSRFSAVKEGNGNYCEHQQEDEDGPRDGSAFLYWDPLLFVRRSFSAPRSTVLQ